jgi:hypothetical protein
MTKAHGPFGSDEDCAPSPTQYAEYEGHPAFRFRLDELSPAQRRVVARQVGARSLDQLSAHRRAHLESHLGVLIDRWTRGAGPAEVSPRILRRMLVRPDKLFRGIERHRYTAQMVYNARQAAEGLGEGRSAGISRRLVDPTSDPAFEFRLDDLDDGRLRVVERLLEFRGEGSLSGRRRSELEARLGVFLDVWRRHPELLHRRPARARAREGEGIPSAAWLKAMLTSPERVFRHLSVIERRVDAVGHERWLAESAADGAASSSESTMPVPPGGDLAPMSPGTLAARSSVEELAGPTSRPAAGLRPSVRSPNVTARPFVVDPAREPALGFRLSQLSPHQRRAVERFALSRGQRRLEPEEVLGIECFLGVAIDRYSAGGVTTVPPRLLYRMLAAPRRVFGNVSLLDYVAGLVMTERRREWLAGEELPPEALEVGTRVVAGAPGYWLRSARRRVPRGAMRQAVSALRRSRLGGWIAALGDRVDAELDRRPGAASVLMMFMAFQLFRLVHVVFFGQPPEESWFAGSAPIVAGWLRDDMTEAFAILTLTVILAVSTSWRPLARSPWIRPIVLSVVVLLLVSVAGAVPNAYFGSRFWWDRLLLVVLAGLVAAHPAAVPMFVKQCLLLGQHARFPEITAFPVQASGMFREPLIHLLLAFLVTAGLAAIPRLQRVVGGNVLLMVCTGSVAALYLEWLERLTALGPTPWAWVLNDRVGNVWLASWLGGWMPWIPEAMAIVLGRALDVVSVPLLGLFALALVGILVALFDRRLALAVLGILTACHLGYLVVSGVLLWGWLASCGLLALVFLAGGPDTRRASGLLPGAVMAVALLLPPKISHNFQLGHWDTRLANVVELEIVDRDGQAHPLSPTWLAPYDKFLVLQIGLFDERRIGHRGRTQDVKLMSEVESLALASPAELRRRLDVSTPRSLGASLPFLLDPFDQVVVASLRPGRLMWARLVHAWPFHPVHPMMPVAPLPARPWREVLVRQKLMLRSREGLEPIANDVVRRIALSEGAEGAP